MWHLKSITALLANKQFKPRKSRKRALAIETLPTKRLLAGVITAASSVQDLADSSVAEPFYFFRGHDQNFEEIKVT